VKRDRRGTPIEVMVPGGSLAGEDTMKQRDEFSHFVDEQAPIYDQVLRELGAGCKHSHWMWLIFPQLRGLGYSWMSERYAIDSLAQAQRYLTHSLLGPRLNECTALVLDAQGKTAEDIFGGVDALKFHSSVTLFSLCDHSESAFTQAIQKYFAGKADANTLRLLEAIAARSQKHASQEKETE
jgi:uncharacterized protein (DUF1810 family)